MLDEFKVRKPAGFPDHPHRGFETVSKFTLYLDLLMTLGNGSLDNLYNVMTCFVHAGDIHA